MTCNMLYHVGNGPESGLDVLSTACLREFPRPSGTAKNKFQLFVLYARGGRLLLNTTMLRVTMAQLRNATG